MAPSSLLGLVLEDGVEIDVSVGADFFDVVAFDGADVGGDGDASGYAVEHSGERFDYLVVDPGEGDGAFAFAAEVVGAFDPDDSGCGFAFGGGACRDLGGGDEQGDVAAAVSERQS